MGFKLLIFSSNDEPLSGYLDAALESLPLSIHWCRFSEDGFEEDIESLFKKERPNVVLYLYSGEGTTILPHSAMQSVILGCQSLDASFLHLSSYRVFGERWDKNGVLESELPAPEDNRGKRLWQLEQEVLRLERALVLRLPPLLDGPAHGLLAKMIPPMLAEKPLVVSDSKFMSPISLGFLINTLMTMIQQVLCDSSNWGIYHLRCSDPCSEAECADYVYRVLAHERDLSLSEPVVVSSHDSRHFTLGCGNLSGQRTMDDFGVLSPSWRMGIKTIIYQFIGRRYEKTRAV